jgi:GNAT superfamily N-acetyltransferase
MVSDISFRYAPVPEDCAVVRAIVASTGFFNPAEVGIAVELVEERLARGQRCGYFFVFAERGGEVPGYACYGPIDGTEGSFDLYWIAVGDGRRGHGLGRALMEETERVVRAAGGRRVYAETSGRDQYEPTRRFYERLGFVAEARLRDFYAPGDDKVFYVKAL